MGQSLGTRRSPACFHDANYILCDGKKRILASSNYQRYTKRQKIGSQLPSTIILLNDVYFDHTACFFGVKLSFFFLFFQFINFFLARNPFLACNFSIYLLIDSICFDNLEGRTMIKWFAVAFKRSVTTVPDV